MHVSLSLSLSLTHYTKLELPWQPKTAKEYTKTAKKNHSWRLAAKQNPPRIEGQGNMIYLAASRQGYFSCGLAAKLEGLHCTKEILQPPRI